MANNIFDTYETMSLYIGVIFIKHNMTWLCQQYVHIHHTNMHLHTVNVCYVVVKISHIFIFQANIQIGIIPTIFYTRFSCLSLNCTL